MEQPTHTASPADVNIASLLDAQVDTPDDGTQEKAQQQSAADGQQQPAEPKLINGRNKLFFFFSFDGFEDKKTTESTFNHTVPSLAHR